MQPLNRRKPLALVPFSITSGSKETGVYCLFFLLIFVVSLSLSLSLLAREEK